MSKKDKIYAKAKASPNNIHFDDLCLLAEHVGFVLRNTRKGTSHNMTYRHSMIREALMNFQRGSSGKAIPYQVRQLIDFIDENDLMEE